MANYFYTDANGTKQGPYNEQQLQSLAAQGQITQTTPLETDMGHRGTAGQIPGLFAPASVPPFAQETSQTSNWMQSLGISILRWLFDLKFRDIRIHVINRAICMILYIICWIIAALYLLAGTFWMFALAAHDGNRVMLLGIPFLWFGIALALALSRLYLEFCTLVIDWMVETTKAARIYIENHNENNS